MRQAQAAFEYLITYGWALMIVLVLVGVAIYTGVLSPENFKEESCVFGPQIECLDAALGNEGTVVLMLRNNLGDSLNITGISTTDLVLDDNYLDTGIIIKNGRTKVIAINTTDDPLDEGDRISLNIKLTFQRAYLANAASHTITGDLFLRICEGDVQYDGQFYIEGC